MLKYIAVVIILAIGFAYCATRLFNYGLQKVEETTQLQKKADRRLEIIREVTDAGKIGEITEVRELTDDSVSQRQKVKRYELRVGDSASAVILAFGNPISKETVDKTEIYKYHSCNVVLAKDRVIGWSIR